MEIKTDFYSKVEKWTKLCKAKLRLPAFDILGIVYKIPCNDCDSGVVGENGRTFNILLKENMKAYRTDHISSKFVIHSPAPDLKM